MSSALQFLLLESELYKLCSQVITLRQTVLTRSYNLLSCHSTMVDMTYHSVLLPFLMFQSYVFKSNYEVIFYQAQCLVWLGFVS